MTEKMGTMDMHDKIVNTINILLQALKQSIVVDQKMEVHEVLAAQQLTNYLVAILAVAASTLWIVKRRRPSQQNIQSPSFHPPSLSSSFSSTTETQLEVKTFVSGNRQNDSTNAAESQITSLPSSLSQLASKQSAKNEFIERVGNSYGYANSRKGFIDDWRELEFPSLIPPLKSTKIKNDMDTTNNGSCAGHDVESSSEEVSEAEVYLDYAGGALPTRTQLSRIYQQCNTQILANPHSQGGGLASDRTWKLMQMSRDAVMKHFGISEDVDVIFDDDLVNDENQRQDSSHNSASCPGYQLVFTSGATGSLRLVAERFPWRVLNFASKYDSRHSTHRPYNANENNIAKTSRHSMHHENLGTEMEIKSERFFQNNQDTVQYQSLLLYPQNVHTSVIGMRNVVLEHGARFQCVSVDELLNATPEWFQSLVEGVGFGEDDTAEIARNETIEGQSAHKETDAKENVAIASELPQDRIIWMHHLLILPLECNFGGDRFDWSNTIAAARASCESSNVCGLKLQSPRQFINNTKIQIRHKWHTLLDIAKAASTSPVHLPTAAPGGGPDYAVASFYKLFGLPTGLGCLLLKKQPQTYGTPHRNGLDVKDQGVTNGVHAPFLEHRIRRHYFGGGSVDVVLPHRDFTVARNVSGFAATDHLSGYKHHEDEENSGLGVLVHGTEHYRGIVELVHGFQELHDLGGIKAVSLHSTCLAAELVRRLRLLVHDNASPVVHIYGQWKSFIGNAKDTSCPGPTVAFNICDRDGSIIGYDEASRLAILNRPPIQLRTGCFCNPGACQGALSLTDDDVIEQHASGHVCGDRRGIVCGKPTGAIRASFGKDSSWEDMDALAFFVEKVFVSQVEIKPSSQSRESPLSRIETSSMKIESIFVFPIKSCAAMKVSRWPINRRTGRLAFDREFALVDSSGSAMRLHSYPQMSQIRSRIDLVAKMLTVTAPLHDDLVLNLEHSNNMCDHTNTCRDIQVCGALCKGDIWGGSEASQWFSSVLSIRCWLARHNESFEKNNLIRSGNQRDVEAYSNEAALLLVSQRSISILNSIISAQGWGRLVESRHFRPNIVVKNKNPKEGVLIEDENPEDSWENIAITTKNTELELVAVGKCARCQMVDVDPSSGMKGNTLRALAQYRRKRGKIYFGTFFTGVEYNGDDVVWLENGDTIVPK